MGLDYYGILELNRMASIFDIKKAFRRLSLKYHPERFLDPKAQKIFESICEAYDVLSYPKTRALYDQFGEEAIKAGVPQPPSESQPEGYFEVYTFHGDADKVFREFFGVDSPFADIFIPNIGPPGKFVGDDGRSKKQFGPTIEKQVPMNLEEIYHGCKKTVTLVQKMFDDDNHISKIIEKKYTFHVPSGCPNNRRFIFPGAGDEGPNIIPGDVIFVVKIEPDPRFRIDGNNLIVTKRLALGHALTGSIIDVWTVDDKILHVPVCGIMKPGHQLVISGEGLPIEGTQYKGDLIIEFQVDFPERMSQTQKALIRKALLRTPPDQ